jgi:hypothetical protein
MGALHRCVAIAMMVMAGACGRVGFDPLGGDDGDDGGDDGGPCTSFDAWEPPVHLGDVVNSTADDTSPTLTADELVLYFDSNRGGGAGSRDLWVATRTTRDEAFGAAVNLPSLNSTANDFTPALSPDGGELYFASNAGAANTLDLYVATRTDVVTFGPRTEIGPLAGDGIDESGADIADDNVTMYFARSDPPTADAEIVIATRINTATDWVPGPLVAEINLASNIDRNPALSPDGLELYFESDRGVGNRLYVARRTVADGPFMPPTEVVELNTAGNSNRDAALSADGRTLYFSSSRPGGRGNHDLWMARRGCALTTLR